MKKLFFTLGLLLALTQLVEATTRADLIEQFRNRLDEQRLPNSSFTDSTASFWLNAGQEAVVRLGGFIPKTVKFRFGAHRVFSLPLTARGVTKVFGVSARHQNEPYTVLSNPGFQFDTIAFQYSIIWINEDSADLFLKIGPIRGRTETKDFTFAFDTTLYRLPTSFWQVRSVTVFNEPDWNPMLFNPGFTIDTTVSQYDIVWYRPDSMFLQVKAQQIADGDTMRVQYAATRNILDTLYVEYVATANVLTHDTSTVDVPADLIHLVIKEAMGYFHEAFGNYQQAQRLWQEVRMDMGLLKQGAPQQ